MWWSAKRVRLRLTVMGCEVFKTGGGGAKGVTAVACKAEGDRFEVCDKEGVCAFR
jgi:hypothetical protein